MKKMMSSMSGMTIVHALWRQKQENDRASQCHIVRLCLKNRIIKWNLKMTVFFALSSSTHTCACTRAHTHRIIHKEINIRKVFTTVIKSITYAFNVSLIKKRWKGFYSYRQSTTEKHYLSKCGKQLVMGCPVPIDKSTTQLLHIGPRKHYGRGAEKF